jgi:hypothetical protein
MEIPCLFYKHQTNKKKWKRKGGNMIARLWGTLTGNQLKVFALEYPYGTKTS